MTTISASLDDENYMLGVDCDGATVRLFRETASGVVPVSFDEWLKIQKMLESPPGDYLLVDIYKSGGRLYNYKTHTDLSED